MHEFVDALRRLLSWVAALTIAAVVLGLIVRFILAPLADAALATPGGLLLVALAALWLRRGRRKWLP